MPRGRGRAWCTTLLPGLLAADIARAACLAIVSSPEGAPLARIALPDADPVFRITYRHSVTRTPVDERYRVDGDAIVQTELRFEEHGPGLPTEADAGAQWARVDGRFVVTLNRRSSRVAMRIDRSTHPALATSARNVDLAQWGERALVLSGATGRCEAP